MGSLRVVVVLLISYAFSVIHGVPLEEFYPHGPEIDTVASYSQQNLNTEVNLRTPIKFFDEIYNTIYVNEYGCLSFRGPIYQFINIPFPLDYPIIAALYSHVSTRVSGSIFYRETQDEQLLQRANDEIRRSFPRYSATFKPTSLFISTWKDVGHQNGARDKVNTFQIVIITDGEESFVEFFYADNGIQWIQSKSGENQHSDAKAQAGLMQDRAVYILPTSGTDQVQNLDKTSNTDVRGVWIFRVGILQNIGKIDAPPPSYYFSSEGTCETASARCHSKSTCVDDGTGSCCVCKSGYFGNGINCIPEGPLRIAGKLSMDINGIKVNNMDVQSYVVTSDGRSYTAVTRVPKTIGYSAQLLSFLANSIGWLFARSVNTMNGYQITGGVFNYTADIIFSNGQRVTIEERFLGHDVFDKLKMEGTITGTTPELLVGAKVDLDDYQEEFTHSADGLFQSQSSHKYELTGHSVPEISFRIVQNINYVEGCKGITQNTTSTRVKTARNMIAYEARENIMRIANTNKISILNVGEDPCLNFSCIANSSCVIEDEKPTCSCNKGFQALYPDGGHEDFGCFDINECNEGRHTCHHFAFCINEVGSFNCQCRPGYTGNGYQCTAERATPSVSPCESDPRACNPPHSTCTDPTDYRSCNCDPGYQKDYLDDSRIAFKCTDLDECQYLSICNINADCYNFPGSYTCRCRPGFYGDGVTTCERESTTSDSHQENQQQIPTSCEQVNCPENAECIEDQNGPHCDCIQGFARNGGACVQEQTSADDKPSCAEANDCSPNAQCIYNEAASYHICYCLEGYQGDGYDCNLKTEADGMKANLICLSKGNNCFCPEGYLREGKDSPLCVKEEACAKCNIHASCKYGPDGEATCICDAGFTGDGITCETATSSNYTTIPCSKRDEPLQRVKEDGRVEHYYESTTSTQCGRNAYCTENADSNSFECVCHDGFYRDGDVCISEIPPEKECEEICTSNAECDPDTKECKCLPGYEGDGVNECEKESEQIQTCDITQNCHQNAECLYNETTFAYKCHCQKGYVGDGVECHPDKTCVEDKSLCGRDASCVIGTMGHFHCECNEGFLGNGTICKPINKKESDFLLVNSGMSMIRVPYMPTPSDRGRPINVQPNKIFIGIAVDCVDSLVYWSVIDSQNKASIKRSYYDGKNVETVISDNLKTPEGVSIDWISRELYWTDSGLQTISKLNLNTKVLKTIINKDLVNPRGIAVHPYYRKVFWSDWKRNNPKIEWANDDGSDREVLLRSPDIKLPNSLAIDFGTDELCWVDADLKSVECMSIRTRNRRKVFSGCTYPFGLTITDDRYYWTEWKTGRIESANKEGNKTQSITLPVIGNTYLYGVAAVPKKCPGT